MHIASNIAQQQSSALDTILEVLGRHDEETASRIEALFAQGTRKWTPRSGVVTPQDEMLAVVLEALASQSRRIDELEEASKPRPRGRPRKQDAS
jgi:hypothetical protein